MCVCVCVKLLCLGLGRMEDDGEDELWERTESFFRAMVCQL